MLSQVLHWSNPDKREGWFYKTRADFSLELELTEKQIRRCRSNLEELGYIETKIVRVANSPSTWYRPCPERIIEEYKKHRPKRADDRPWGAAAPALGGQSSISPIFNTNITPNSDEEAEMDRLWAAADKVSIQQFLLGLGKGEKE